MIGKHLSSVKFCVHITKNNLVELVQREDPIFIKLVSNTTDSSYVNSPGYLYNSSKLDIEKRFPPSTTQKFVDGFITKTESINAREKIVIFTR